MGMEHSTFKVLMCIFIKTLRGEGNDNPFQYSSPENSMDGGAWQTVALGVARAEAL